MPSNRAARGDFVQTDKQIILDELKKIGFSNEWEIQFIREKFGIYVFRVTKEKESYVGKYFNDDQLHGRNEIKHYDMLKSIGVPTLEVIAHTDCFIILEDILTSNLYRLGIEDDMSNTKVAGLIGRWFKQLHSNGRKYNSLMNLNFLENLEYELKHEKILIAIEKSSTSKNPFWDMLINNIEHLKDTYLRLCDTITFNDFWWDNLAVAKDCSAAIMFDYNCVFRKYAYADIRHVLSVLSKEAGVAFLEEYGNINENEKAFDELFWPVTGLIGAFNMDVFPTWGDNFLDMLTNGELIQRIQILNLG